MSNGMDSARNFLMRRRSTIEYSEYKSDNSFAIFN